MEPIPGIGRRTVLRAVLAAATAAGTAVANTAFGGAANAAPAEPPATADTGHAPSGTGHRHLIGVL